MTRTPAQRADIVVGLGASAGGIDPICAVLSGLKPDLPAAVLVVVHLNAAAPSVLDRILARCASMPVTFATDGAPLEPGHVYLAPPGVHLVTRDGRLELDRGPTVNAVRPSVDVLFRSMASEYGPRCVGVILSGTRYDGAAGLSAVKRAGGYAIVQDPDDAVFPGMPFSARNLADPDEIAPASGIAAIIGNAVTRIHERAGVAAGDPIEDPPAADVEPRSQARPSELACPDCSGVLWEQPEDSIYRCRIGHAYSLESLVARHAQKLEEALWSGVVALEEHAELCQRLARRLALGGNQSVRARYEREASSVMDDARLLRSVVLALENPPPTE